MSDGPDREAVMAAKGNFERARTLAEEDPVKSIAITLSSAGQLLTAALLSDLDDE